MAAPDLVIRGAEWLGIPSDLYVFRGKILEVTAHDESRVHEGANVVDAAGLTLLPSLIDCHTHMREPGQEYKEEIRTGLAAAAHGGFGTIMAMANTTPVNDEASVTEAMLLAAKKSWPKGPRLLPVGALTKGLKGDELAPMAELAREGCAAFSNDGLPVASTEIMRRAVEYAADLGKIVIDHCEDPWLGKGAGMNESALSGRMGLKGQPTVSEALQVARDILLAEYLNTPIHLAHISCIQSLELIAWAKARGVKITAETCPHYLLFTEELTRDYNTMAKVNPPLRTEDDRQAMIRALKDRTIDILVTDHAPHAAHEKETPFDEAPNGISGLDTALSLCWSLVAENILDQEVLIRAFCTRPAEIFSLSANTFAPGDPADFILFDANAVWQVTPEAMYSKGKNTPCLGTTLPGRVQAHFMAGKRIV